MTVTRSIKAARILTDDDLLASQTVQISRPSFHNLHDRRNLGVNSWRIDQCKSCGHVTAGIRGSEVGACVCMRVELTPAVLDNSLHIARMKDDMGSAIGSMRAADVAANGAETSSGRAAA